MEVVLLIIINFAISMMVGNLTVSLIDKVIICRGFRLTSTSKYIIFSMLVIIAGIICGQMIVYL